MYLMGIDVGTTGVKTILITERGETVAEAAETYPLLSPQNGWFEQQPEDWWRATRDSIDRALSRAKPSEVAAIGLSGQYHGLVTLDRDDHVIRPCILWNDQRTATQSEKIRETVGRETLLRVAAAQGGPYFTACKLVWVRDNEPRNYERIRRIMLPKDYIRLRLTGEHCTDVTDASGTLFLDVGRRAWSRELLDKMGVEHRILPSLVESSAVSGVVSKRGAEETGLAVGIPVAGGAGDQAAAAVGLGIVSEGCFSLSVGTSGVIYGSTNRLIVDSEGRFDTFCHAVPGKWCVLSCINSAAGTYQWFQDKMAEWEREEAGRSGASLYEILEAAASKIPAGSDRLMFLPYLAGERHPHTDTNARGVLFGLHAGHGKAHIVRSLLEGVAYCFRDCLEAIKRHNVDFDELRATGGGAQSRLWMDILVNSIGVPITTMGSNTGGASFGAAVLAGVCAGEYSSVEEACSGIVRPGPVLSPVPETASVYESYYQFFRTLYPVLRDSYQRLASLP